jgi:uncharacterized protein YxeA
MKKPTSFWIIILLMIFLGITTVTEARTGGTSSDSSKTSSSSKSKTKTTGSSSYSKTSKTDSAFSNAAKTNQARMAWQERNKPVVAPAPVPTPAPVPNVAAPSRDDSKVERQLAEIQRQLADQKRRDQVIAAAQTAAQIAAQAAFNKRQPVTTIPTPQAVTSPVKPPVNPVNTPTTTPEKAESGGGSWFITLLVIGGIVFVIYWLLKSKSSQTNYRL